MPDAGGEVVIIFIVQDRVVVSVDQVEVGSVLRVGTRRVDVGPSPCRQKLINEPVRVCFKEVVLTSECLES